MGVGGSWGSCFPGRNKTSALAWSVMLFHICCSQNNLLVIQNKLPKWPETWWEWFVASSEESLDLLIFQPFTCCNKAYLLWMDRLILVFSYAGNLRTGQTGKFPISLFDPPLFFSLNCCMVTCLHFLIGHLRKLSSQLSQEIFWIFNIRDGHQKKVVRAGLWC